MLTIHKPTRRRFLEQFAAATTAAWALNSNGHAFGFDSPNERPNVAAIGLRNQGISDVKNSMPYANIAALIDLDSGILGRYVEQVAEQQGKCPDAYKDYRRVLERNDIDAVLIATPDHWHAKIAIEAMLAGKDVYCQKPLTFDIDEGKLIQKVLRQTNRVFQVGTQKRSNPDKFIPAIALVHSGRLGKITRVVCGLNPGPTSEKIPVAPVPKELDWDFWVGPAPKVEYRALPKIREGYGGGVPESSNGHYSFRWWYNFGGAKTTDWGAHFVDIATWGLNCRGTGPSRVVPVSYKLHVSYKNGYAIEKDRYDTPTEFEIHAHMPEDHLLVMRTSGRTGVLFEGTKGRIFVNDDSLQGKPVEELENDPLPEQLLVDTYRGMTPGSHHGNFFDCIKTRREPISDVASHHRMLTTCHLANISMRLGRELQWDPVQEKIIDDEANGFLSREYRKGFEIEGI